jgi:subtilisin
LNKNDHYPDDPVNVDIALLDTGIDLDHPDLLNVYNQISFVPGTQSADDDNGHGTHVTGIAAARDNNLGVVGVAPGARLWAVKVLDSNGQGLISDIIKGIDYLGQHASEVDVINMSFGL